MEPTFIVLPLLALVDSTSIGTLVIPVLMLLAPGRPSLRRLAAYLGVVAGLYLVIGLALVGAADAAMQILQSDGTALIGIVIEALLGIALVAYAITRWRRPPSPERSRMRALRERALGPQAPLLALLGVAVLAVVVEAASMLPYIGAVALVARAELGWPITTLVLAGYCLIMILPALLLGLLRRVAAGRVEPMLQRIAAWSERSAGSPAILWVTAVLGVALVIDAAVRA